MSRVLLLQPSMGNYYRRSPVRGAVTLSPPLNLAILAGALENAGHQVQVWDLESKPRPRLEEDIKSWGPHVVGVTMRTPGFGEGKGLASAARRACPKARIVAGGPHASTCPDDVVGPHTDFDVAVRGEGEQAIVAIANNAPLQTISGLHWCDHLGVEAGQTEDGTYLENLDELPMPAWHHFDVPRYSRRSLVAPVVPVADLESSRGCLAKCVYCTKDVFGRTFRMHSPEGLVDRIEHAVGHGFRAFNLVDDSFTMRLPRAKAVCQTLIDRNLQVPWTTTNGLRVANVDQEFFHLAKRSGLYLVAFGFESADDATLKAIKKGATTKQARRAVAWAKAAGLTTVGYFMIGLPGDTEKSMRDTANFAASLGLDYAKFSITMPLPGTPLWNDWAPLMKPGFDWEFSFHRQASEWFDHPDLSWPQIESGVRYAYRTFYGRPRWIGRWLKRSVRTGELWSQVAQSGAWAIRMSAQGLRSAG